MERRPFCDPENFSSGYIMRSQDILFKQGSGEPWTHMLEYHQERETLPNADLDDGSLVYGRTRVAPRTDDAPPARRTARQVNASGQPAVGPVSSYRAAPGRAARGAAATSPNNEVANSRVRPTRQATSCSMPNSPESSGGTVLSDRCANQLHRDPLSLRGSRPRPQANET